MKALIVYESMFGNTAKVAGAVADGVRKHMAVELLAADHAPATAADGVDLLVVGGPTHAFSMTRSNTREDAVRQGATTATTTGIREWIRQLHDGRHAELVATFDTRVARTGGKVRHFPGSAAKSAAKALHKHGYSTALKPESFWVKDTAGPLFDGELERAREWGDHLAETIEHAAQAR